MSRVVNIIISTVMWCAIVAYIVAASSYSRDRRAAITVRELRIVVVDTVQNRVIDTRKVATWLAEENINPVGQPINDADTRAIEHSLTSRPEVKAASAWINLDGILTVRVEARTPLLRVRSSGGYRFWFTDDGYILQDRGDFSAYTPIVTGSVPFPFSPSSSGSYGKMQRDNYNDFLARFTAIEAEHRSLVSQYNTTRARLRSVRASSPGRLWGKLRDSLFYVDKAIRTSELAKEVSRLESDLAKLTASNLSLKEKEKKSHQSYRFLSKLANFVGFIERDDFWSAQIVQINVVEGSGSPQLEIIPRAGDHTVLFGELDGTETRKLENLKLFYLDGLWYEGWDKYRYIDVKYENQIVCTK